MRLLEENFIQVDISFDKHNPMKLKETPSLSNVKIARHDWGHFESVAWHHSYKRSRVRTFPHLFHRSTTRESQRYYQ